MKRSAHLARLVLSLVALAMAGGCSGKKPAGPGPATERAGAPGRAKKPPEKGGDRAEKGAGKERSPDVVVLTSEQLSRLDLRVVPAPAGRAEASVSAPATLAFHPDRVAQLGPRLSAKVVRVTRDLGEEVEAGDTVAILDSVALGKAKARYLVSRARFETARTTYEREKILAKQKISSQAHLQEARGRFKEARAERDAIHEELRLYGLSRKVIHTIAPAGEHPLSYYRLKTPMAGVVQRRDLVPGQTVASTETPVHIVDTSEMWVWVDAFERDLPRLAPGQPMDLSVRALPGRRFSGTVSWISRKLDEKTRTVRLRAVVKNADNLLRAGMFGTARIRTGSEATYALIPVGAVQRLGDRKVVFVPEGTEGRFRAQGVRLGDEHGGKVEILGGLSPGDRVVVAGAFSLKSALTASTRDTDD